MMKSTWEMLLLQQPWDGDQPNYTNHLAAGHKTAENWSPMRITIKLWSGR